MDKAALRERFQRIRADAARDGNEAARRLALMALAEGPELGPGVVLSGYIAMRDEIDPRPLLEHAAARGVQIALPVTLDRDAPLIFRAYDGGPLEHKDAWGVPVPAQGSEDVIPDVVLVPGLAFDLSGHRLGYGAGNYDRTLAKLRQTRQVIAVGLSFAPQVVSALPVEPHDVALDWVITNEGVAKRPD